MAMNIMNCRGRMFKILGILGCKWYSRMLLFDILYILFLGWGKMSDLFTWRI